MLLVLLIVRVNSPVYSAPAITQAGKEAGCRGERGCGRHVALGLQQTTDTTYTATYKRPGACNRSPDSAQHVHTARALNRWRMASDSTKKGMSQEAPPVRINPPSKGDLTLASM